MMAFYAQVKWLHVAAVLLSGAIFVWRGVLVQMGRQRFAMSAHVRHASYGVDTLLLAAGFVLVAILPGAMFANGWLLAKLALLVAYVVAGTFALKRGRTPRVRSACFVVALLTYLTIISIARTHNPQGWLLWLH